MAKFKPTPLSQAPTTGNPVIDALRLLVEVGLNISDKELFLCSNCSKVIIMDKKGPKAVVCSYCQQPVDWVGLKTRLTKRCPVCGKEALDFNSVVCQDHFPVVKLETVEVPI